MSYTECFTAWGVAGLLISLLVLLIVRVGKLRGEIDKLNELLWRPPGLQSSEVRASPAIAYSVIEGGKMPDWHKARVSTRSGRR